MQQADQALTTRANTFAPGIVINSTSARMRRRTSIENEIDRLIGMLDADDGDCDLEDGDVDCCTAHDDDPRPSWMLGMRTDWLPGDADDAEPEEDVCLAGDDGCGAVAIGVGPAWGSAWDEPDSIPTYDLDQSRGPQEARWAA